MLELFFISIKPKFENVNLTHFDFSPADVVLKLKFMINQVFLFHGAFHMTPVVRQHPAVRFDKYE